MSGSQGLSAEPKRPHKPDGPGLVPLAVPRGGHPLVQILGGGVGWQRRLFLLARLPRAPAGHVEPGACPAQEGRAEADRLAPPQCAARRGGHRLRKVTRELTARSRARPHGVPGERRLQSRLREVEREEGLAPVGEEAQHEASLPRLRRLGQSALWRRRRGGGGRRLTREDEDAG